MNKVVWIVIGIVLIFAAFKAVQGLLTIGLLAAGAYMVYWGYTRVGEGKEE